MQNPYFDMRMLSGLLGVKDPRQAGATDTGQVRTQPGFRSLNPMLGGLLGGMGGGGWMGGMQQQPMMGYGGRASPSAQMFQQYMQQAMQRYPQQGGFYGFQGYQFPQRQAPAAAPASQAPTTSPTGDPRYWDATGGGN
jgi:hypothetical protein